MGETFGSGIKSFYLLRTALFSVGSATTLNYLLRNEFGLDDDPNNVATVIDAFYFSMVTLTTLGFGDIAPSTQLGRAIIAMEGAFGLVLFALFASMMFRKMAP
jgi:voltage-gated potassium channel Kch